jgi:hypothetical protein
MAIVKKVQNRFRAITGRNRLNPANDRKFQVAAL